MEPDAILLAALLLVVALVAGGFLITRIYLLVSKGELAVKGVIYSRRTTPIYYWILLANVVVCTPIVFAIAGFCVFALWISL